MNRKLIYLTALMLVLIASNSMAKKQNGRRGKKGRVGDFGRSGPERQLKAICRIFADESSVFDACEDIRENVETFMDEKEENPKHF